MVLHFVSGTWGRAGGNFGFTAERMEELSAREFLAVDELVIIAFSP